jgi:hypothetical protein
MAMRRLAQGNGASKVASESFMFQNIVSIEIDIPQSEDPRIEQTFKLKGSVLGFERRGTCCQIAKQMFNYIKTKKLKNTEISTIKNSSPSCGRIKNNQH